MFSPKSLLVAMFSIALSVQAVPVENIVARQPLKCGLVGVVTFPGVTTPFMINRCLCSETLLELSLDHYSELPGLPTQYVIDTLLDPISDSPSCTPDSKLPIHPDLPIVRRQTTVEDLLNTLLSLLSDLLNGSGGGGGDGDDGVGEE